MKGLLIQFGIDLYLTYAFLKENIGKGNSLDRYVFLNETPWLDGATNNNFEDLVTLEDKKTLTNFHHILPLFLVILKNYQENKDLFSNIEQQILSLGLTDRIYNFRNIKKIIESTKQKILTINLDKYGFIGISSIYNMFFHTIITIFLIRTIYPEIKIIIGGHLFNIHRTVNELLLKSNLIDSCILGEGENTLPEVLKSFSSTPIRFKNEIVEDLNSVALKSHVVAPGHKNRGWSEKVLNINLTRGCQNRCSYCETPFRYRYFNIEQTVDYIEKGIDKYNIPHIFFVDDYWNKNTLYEYTTAILKKNLQKKIVSQFFRPLVRDIHLDESIELLKKTNSSVYIGAETFSERLLDLINKRITVDQINISLKKLQENDIFFILNSLFLLPSETEKEFNDSLNNFFKLAVRNKGCLNYLNSLRLQPLSDFYINKEKYGISFKYFPDSIKNIIPEFGNFIENIPCSYIDNSDPDNYLYYKKKIVLDAANRLIRKILGR
jgi:radical SAM superfamily enzyme YgiQ (UPF0313 family)